MDKEYVYIIRGNKYYIIKEISKEEANNQLGHITKNNFIIKKNTDRYDKLLEIVKQVPTEGTFSKLPTLINNLYQRINDKYPYLVSNPSISTDIVNEKIALVVTNDIIKSVYSKNQKSSRTRVHIDYNTAQEFLKVCSGELRRESASKDLWEYWENKASDIFADQINKVKNFWKGRN